VLASDAVRRLLIRITQANATGNALAPNEELLGRAFKGRREQVVIATKFGSRFDGNRIVGWTGDPSISAKR
jgi:aryl-alcohol dehydrogenase-like predicted oxidoreductase